MILSCHHITKAFVENTVLSDVSFHLEKGEKAAVIGINGAGKSTLLKIITGEMQADSGTVSIARDQKIGYLAQNQNLTSSNSIYQEMLSVRQDVLDMEKEIAESERQMNKVKGEALNALMARYTSLLERYDMESGYSYKGEIVGILRGLGFSDQDFEQPVSTLSGGQKTRVALGKLLLQKPPIILLSWKIQSAQSSTETILFTQSRKKPCVSSSAKHGLTTRPRSVTRRRSSQSCAGSTGRNPSAGRRAGKRCCRRPRWWKSLWNCGMTCAWS